MNGTRIGWHYLIIFGAVGANANCQGRVNSCRQRLLLFRRRRICVSGNSCYEIRTAVQYVISVTDRTAQVVSHSSGRQSKAKPRVSEDKKTTGL